VKNDLDLDVFQCPKAVLHRVEKLYKIISSEPVCVIILPLLDKLTPFVDSAVVRENKFTIILGM
jgi:hypothetical protein